MADRNPYLSGERSQEKNDHETINEEDAHRRFAENRAELTQDAANALHEPNAPAPPVPMDHPKPGEHKKA